MENLDRMTATGAQPLPGLSPSGATQGSYVDWSAILGGAAVAVALGLLFTGFGAALGLTALSAQEGEGSGLVGFIISTIWILLSMIAAYATGGYIAGRMRRRIDAATSDEVTVRDGFNGLIVWAIGTVLSAMVLGSVISSAVSTVGSIAATGVEVAGAAAGSAAGGAMIAASAMMPDDMSADPMDFITGTLLRPTTVTPGPDAQSTTTDAMSILANVMVTGKISDSDRAYLVQLTAARTGMTAAEVEARVEQAVTAAQSARAEAERLAAEAEVMAREAAETARISAILTAFLLTATALVAAATAYVCAVKGGRHRDEGRIFGGFAYRG